MIPGVKAKLLEGKRGLIVGIANDQSIAWGCAKAFRAFGAELAVTYLNDKAKKYVEPLARELEGSDPHAARVSTPGQMEAVFERIAKDWGSLDFVVHSIAFSPKEALQGRVVDVRATVPDHHGRVVLDVHPHGASGRAAMRKGGTLFTMTYYGSQMVVKNYNIMGVAKAALESAVRYLAAELGPKGIRVHAIRPGRSRPCGLGHSRIRRTARQGPRQRRPRAAWSASRTWAATAFLAHDAARLMTGETLYIDGGYHIID